MPQQTFGKHHTEYLRQNHDKLTIRQLKEGLADIGLKHIRLKEIRDKLTKLKLSEKPDVDYQKEMRRQRSANQARLQVKQDLQKKQAIIDRVIRQHYPELGAEGVRKAIAKIKSQYRFYLTIEKIHARAKELGVKHVDHRIRVLPDNLRYAAQVVNDYNEQYATNFFIVSVCDDVGHIEDTYLASYKKDLIQGMIMKVYDAGYNIRKEGSKAFRISGQPTQEQ